jgi:hypothetical protein
MGNLQVFFLKMQIGESHKKLPEVVPKYDSVSNSALWPN